MFFSPASNPKDRGQARRPATIVPSIFDLPTLAPALGHGPRLALTSRIPSPHPRNLDDRAGPAVPVDSSKRLAPDMNIGWIRVYLKDFVLDHDCLSRGPMAVKVAI